MKFGKRFFMWTLVVSVLLLSFIAAASEEYITTYDFDSGIAKGIEYFNSQMYYEAKDEFVWFKEGNKNRLNDGQIDYLDGYIDALNNKIYDLEHTSYQKSMSTSDFDNGMKKGINYFNNGLYYEARDEFVWFKNENENYLNEGQLKYLNDYINGVNTRIYNLQHPQTSNSYSSSSSYSSAPAWSNIVYITPYGIRYHYKASCANSKNTTSVDINTAIRRGYTPCKKCVR